MEIEEVYNKVINLWKEHPISPHRVPIFYPDLKSEPLLFIGLNPSFDKKEFRRILKGTKYEYILNNFPEYYKFNNFNVDKIKPLIEIDQIFIEEHNYYSKFKELALSLNVGWKHIDLLFIRETSQKEVKKLEKKDPDFIEKQIELTVKIINKINPKIIVIASAFVSKKLKSKLSLNVINENIGTYLYETQRFKVPVFLSSMLTGGALDTGSYERLKWHLKHVINKFKIA